MAADDLKNVVISVFDHFSTNLSGTATIDFPGAPFDSEAVDEWYQPRMLGPVSNAARKTERREVFTFNVNCFARTGRDSAGTQKSSVWRHLELAGEVVEAFEQEDIPVKDWDAVGDPVITYLRFEEANVVEVVDVVITDLQQATVTLTGWLIN